METKTLWEETSSIRNDYPSLEGEIHTDVVIIGAGFTGISTSYHLQEKGVSTVVVEEHTVGYGASGKNGGMMNTGYKLSPKELIKKFGIEEAKRLDDYALLANETVLEIVRKNNIDCDVKQCGHIGLSRKTKKIEDFRENQEIVSKYFHRDLYILQESEITEELYSDYFKAAYFDPLSYQFHPLNYVRGVAKVTYEMGAQIYENTKALNITKKHGEFKITTSRGIIYAKDLVYGTDGYSKGITKELNKGIFPLASFIIATEQLNDDVIDKLIPHNRNFYNTINLTNYFRRTPDNRIILGGSGINYPAKPKYRKELENLLKNIFPQLQETKIDYFWGGIIGATIDKFPIIGRTSEGAYYSVGYTGHGASQSTLHGKLLSQILTNQERLNPIFETINLKTIPFYQQKEALVSAANIYFRIQDKL